MARADSSWASTPGVRSRMQLQKERETAPEVALRRRLHAMGLRFRVHRRLLSNRRRTTDIVFGPAKVAVYVDGCFWHGCPQHYREPMHNADYWRPKIERNRARDEETDAALRSLGWEVVRVWEHEEVGQAAARIAALVLARRPSITSSADGLATPIHGDLGTA